MLVNAQGQYVINKSAGRRSAASSSSPTSCAAPAPALKEPVVVISADAAATHQSVIRVMEAARVAGLSQITFTTQSTK